MSDDIDVRILYFLYPANIKHQKIIQVKEIISRLASKYHCSIAHNVLSNPDEAKTYFAKKSDAGHQINFVFTDKHTILKHKLVFIHAFTQGQGCEVFMIPQKMKHQPQWAQSLTPNVLHTTLPRMFHEILNK